MTRGGYLFLGFILTTVLGSVGWAVKVDTSPEHYAAVKHQQDIDTLRQTKMTQAIKLVGEVTCKARALTFDAEHSSTEWENDNADASGNVVVYVHCKQILQQGSRTITMEVDDNNDANAIRVIKVDF